MTETPQRPSRRPVGDPAGREGRFPCSRRFAGPGTPARWLLLGAILPLCSAALATPVISEFMAANQTSLADEDGEITDWIELHNPGTDRDQSPGLVADG